MLDEQTIDFLRAGIEHVFPGQWTDYMPGFAARVETNGVGIDITYDKYVTFSSGVLADLRLSEDLVREVAGVSAATSFGHLAISEGQPGNWVVTFSHSVLPGWLDPQSSASVQCIVDILSNFPTIVDTRAVHLQQQFGGTRWSTDEGWWVALASHF